MKSEWYEINKAAKQNPELVGDIVRGRVVIKRGDTQTEIRVQVFLGCWVCYTFDHEIFDRSPEWKWKRWGLMQIPYLRREIEGVESSDR